MDPHKAYLRVMKKVSIMDGSKLLLGRGTNIAVMGKLWTHATSECTASLEEVQTSSLQWL